MAMDCLLDSRSITISALGNPQALPCQLPTWAGHGWGKASPIGIEDCPLTCRSVGLSVQRELQGREF